MIKIRIPETDLLTSRFIFGTASLLNAGQKKDRLNLLAAAVDNGFAHFDTAPYYGFGMAERDLASILKSHPDIKVTTKVGIYSPGGSDQSYVSVVLRKGAGRFHANFSQPEISFDIGKAQRELEGSLRRLGRDHIDVYMLHEPETSLVNIDEWSEWLKQKQKQGVIGYIGLAGMARNLEQFLRTAPGFAQIIQMPDSLHEHEADLLSKYERPMQITYGYLSSARATGNTLNATAILKDALKRNNHGAIIVSSTKISRLAQYQKLISESDSD